MAQRDVGWRLFRKWLKRNKKPSINYVASIDDPVIEKISDEKDFARTIERLGYLNHLNSVYFE
jgi:hypothetical protein